MIILKNLHIKIEVYLAFCKWNFRNAGKCNLNQEITLEKNEWKKLFSKTKFFSLEFELEMKKEDIDTS